MLAGISLQPTHESRLPQVTAAAQPKRGTCLYPLPAHISSPQHYKGNDDDNTMRKTTSPALCIAVLQQPPFLAPDEMVCAALSV